MSIQHIVMWKLKNASNAGHLDLLGALRENRSVLDFQP